MARRRISFQIYSARQFPPVEAQLQRLGEIGYDAIEPYAGAYGNDPSGFRAKAEAAGLSIPTAHLPLAELDANPQRFANTAKALGLETAIIPHVGGDARPRDLGGWKALGERLNEHAARLAEDGLGLAWHNHDFEYMPLADGSRPIDHILAGDKVMFEPDIGWIVRAGVDPLGELERRINRIAAFHVKDTAPEGVTADDGWTDVGAGTINWQALWTVIGQGGDAPIVIEHDNPSDWQSFASNSYNYVNELAGGS